MLTARIVILNYNGKELLPQCLPSIVEAAAKATFPTQVTILDNCSTDDSLEYVQKNFPDIAIERAPQNKILCSYNDFLPKMKEDIAILLNNDIRVDEGFVDPLMKKFEQTPKTFLVAPRVMSFDGSWIEAGRSKAGIRFGIFWCNARYSGYEKEAMTSSETFSSGFGAFSRKDFLELEGYDDRFFPGIFEDVDLCHRAQKAGYKLYYEPQSAVYHMGQATFKKEFGAQKISALAHRNNFLYTWKNYSGPVFWAQHLFFLPLRLLFALLRGQLPFVQGFFQALKHKKR